MPGAQGHLHRADDLCEVQQQVGFGESRYTEARCSHRHEEELEAERDWGQLHDVEKPGCWTKNQVCREQ